MELNSGYCYRCQLRECLLCLLPYTVSYSVGSTNPDDSGSLFSVVNLSLCVDFFQTDKIVSSPLFGYLLRARGCDGQKLLLCPELLSVGMVCLPGVTGVGANVLSPILRI